MELLRDSNLGSGPLTAAAVVGLAVSLALGVAVTATPSQASPLTGPIAGPVPTGAAGSHPSAEAVLERDLDGWLGLTLPGSAPPEVPRQPTLSLRGPYHVARFTPEGLRVWPREGGRGWSWRLAGVSAGGRPVPGVETGPVTPVEGDGGFVEYRRGGLVERYRGTSRGVEQLFVLERPLPLGSGDLVIAGEVTGGGRFESPGEGWRWGAGLGGVRLGPVVVRDAAGRTVPAGFAVTAETTRLEVDGAALSAAAYPVTIDPEIGVDDFRISAMGPEGDSSYFASSPQIAYNSVRHEILVVWFGNDDLSDGDEVYGQRLDAATGVEIGVDDFKISSMGEGDPTREGERPKVAYNPVDDEYLVVWWGDELSNGEREIYGQRLGGDGSEVGEDDFRISMTGPDGDAGWDAIDTSVAHNPVDNEYLVVWEGCDTVECEVEIYGQRLDGSTGAEVGEDDFRISDMGPDEDLRFNAQDPEVVYNPTHHEYLVIWHGSEVAGKDEQEVYGQRLDAATGAEVGANDFPISANFGDAERLAVAYNPDDDLYLVVWDGTTFGNDPNNEIYGQLLDGATGAEVGADDFLISNMGPPADFDGELAGQDAHVTYGSGDGEFLVVWDGRDTPGSREDEVYGQRLDGATAAEVGANDFRLTRAGPDGDPNLDAFSPVVAYNPVANEYFVAFTADPEVPFDNDIYGQRYAAGLFEDDFEDEEIAEAWRLVRGAWTEELGLLEGTAEPAGSRRLAAALTGGFAGCDRCRVTAVLRVQEPATPVAPAAVPPAASILGWVAAPRSHAVVLLEPDADQVVFAQRENGAWLAHVTAGVALDYDTSYTVEVAFDGADFQVLLDGELLIREPNAAAAEPHGRFGFGSRDADLAVETFHVVPETGG